MKTNRAFTLMELLVVMAIIAILAGMAMGGTQMARKRGSITKAKVAIAALESAVSMYELDMGAYPESGNSNVVAALGDISNPDINWNGPYMEFKESDLEGGEYIDSWGNSYIYTVPGAHNISSFDIYSYGPDGEDQQGSGDDITNW